MGRNTKNSMLSGHSLCFARLTTIKTAMIKPNRQERKGIVPRRYSLNRQILTLLPIK